MHERRWDSKAGCVCVQQDRIGRHSEKANVGLLVKVSVALLFISHVCTTYQSEKSLGPKNFLLRSKSFSFLVLASPLVIRSLQNFFIWFLLPHFLFDKLRGYFFDLFKEIFRSVPFCIRHNKFGKSFLCETCELCDWKAKGNND